MSSVSQLKCTSSQLGMKFSLTSPLLLATGPYRTPIPYHHITIITASLNRPQTPLSFTPGLPLSTFICTIRSVPFGSEGLLTTNPASPASPTPLATAAQPQPSPPSPSSTAPTALAPTLSLPNLESRQLGRRPAGGRRRARKLPTRLRQLWD